MINSLTVTNHLGESIKIELRFPEKSGFLVQKIEGLGPAKADIQVTDVVTIDGGIYNSARLSTRNIVLSLKLLEHSTVEDSRLASYRYFPIKKPISILIETDRRTCVVRGYVESNEPDIFSDSVTTQISILCPDPYFYSVDDQYTMFSGTIPEFQFEFSNESLTQDVIEIGAIENQPMKSVLYTGDASVGIVASIHALGPATNFSMYNAETRETMRIDTTKLTALTGSAIIFGDDITISTVKGAKFVTLLRNGTQYNILNCLSKDTDWIQLVPGDNLLAYTADTGATNLQVIIQNKVLYEGV